MRTLLASKWTYTTLRVVGAALFVGYLIFTKDWRISALWVLAFPAISLSIAWLFVLLKLFDRFPKLNRYLLHPQNKAIGKGLSENEWALAQAKYLESGFRGKALLCSPAEDGFVCVPLLLVGIGVLPAVLGGVAFGVIHLGRFTYLECLGKSLTYALVCYFVLPYGLLTVAAGHLIMDLVGLVVIKMTKHRLSVELRSNPTVERDGPQAARPSQ